MSSSPPSSPAASHSAAALQQRLAELRRGLGNLATGGAAEAAPALPAVAQPPPVQGTVENLVEWLALEVRRRVGIAVNEQVRSKLATIAGRAKREDLVTWVQTLHRAESGSSDWLSLVEMLTVHETYFLRDPGQLDFVRKTALGEAVKRARQAGRNSLQIWSAACSTGEEAYSLAFLAIEALADAGEVTIDSSGGLRWRTPWRIDVLGSDLSRPAVETARRGVYRDFGLGAFRSLPATYWRFFERSEEEEGPIKAATWKVRPDIARMVRFTQFNLMAEVPPASKCDVVLCRNVLIYFDPPGKRHVFRLIHRVLEPQGYAVFGPTDIPDDPNLFETLWGPATVIYRKR